MNPPAGCDGTFFSHRHSGVIVRIPQEIERVLRRASDLKQSGERAVSASSQW